MTQDEMIEWFKSAPMGSRHQRMLWAARKIACLTGASRASQSFDCASQCFRMIARLTLWDTIGAFLNRA